MPNCAATGPHIAASHSDFAVPSSAIFQISKSPTDVLYSSYALDALPQLNGSVSYVTCSRPLPTVRTRICSARPASS